MGNFPNQSTQFSSTNQPLKNGRPKQPKKLKEFIKNLENEKDEVLFPEEDVEVIEKKGKKFYKLKGSKGSKMFLTAYKKALAGNVKWAEFLVKMGFAGGFEPVKQQTKLDLVTPQDLIDALNS